MKDLMDSLGIPGELQEAILQKHGALVADYDKRLRDQAVDHAVRQAVSAAGGRNVTAIRALLDETSFGDDPESDARAAVAKVKQENPYLFAGLFTAPGTGGPAPRPVTHRDLEKMSLAEYRAYRQGNA